MKYNHLPDGASRACFAAALILAAAASGQTTVNLKGVSYNLWDAPMVLLDGPCAMGAWSSSTNYHDLEAVSYSGTWYRAIAQTGPSTVGPITPGTNASYWVASTNNLSTSGATYTCNMWGTSGHGKAQSGNPAYSASQSGANNLIASKYSTQPGAQIGNLYSPGFSASNFGNGFNCALQWVAEGAPDLANDSAGYLACAIASITNVEDINLGAFLCDQTSGDCGAYFANTDYLSYYDSWIAQIYSIVRDKLTSAQITTFNNKIWNDNSSSNNGLGLNGNPSGTCNQPVLKGGTPVLGSASGTITTHSWFSYYYGGGTPTLAQTLTVTGSGTHFKTDVVVGDVIYGVGHVASITSDTSLQLDAPAANDLTNQPLNAATPGGSAGLGGGVVAGWVDSNNVCGLVWYLKHHGYSPAVGTGTYTNSYPQGGGGGGTPGGGPMDFNLIITKLAGFIPLALATAADDARAQTAITQYFNFFYDYTWAEARQESGGFYRPNAGYTTGRDDWMMPQILLALTNSVPSYNNAGLLGDWVSGVMPFMYMASINDQLGGQVMPWNGSSGNGYFALRAAVMTAALYPGSAAASQVNYWQKTTRGDYSTSANPSGGNAYTQGNNGTNAGMLFIYTDPSNAGTSPSSLNTQYIFDETDINPNGGPSASATTCTSTFYSIINGQDCRLTYWVSRTGFAGTDSILFQQVPFWDGQDHQDTGGLTGMALSIYRQGFLLAGDSEFGDCYIINSPACPQGRAVISIGGNSGWPVANGAQGWANPEIRWAGSHPTGVSSNKYAYSMFEGNLQYTATVTHALREVAHLKGGSQDYVVVHDYVSVPSGTTIESNWPLFLGPDYYFSRSGTVTATSWASSKQAQVVVTNASLIMQAVPVAGANSLAAIDAGVGSNGFARLEQLCASTNGSTCNSSATSMESIVVLKPANTTSPSMPALTQLPASGAAVVQIADTSAPKVAAFVTGASTVTSLSFTSTHSGTAQYVIAGLTAGTYNVTVGGSTVSGSPFTVNSGDNTLYFESTSGAVTIGGGGAGTPTLSCDLNQDGVVNVLDVQISISAALGLTPCLTQYRLDGSGACTVIDVQRVAAASLGASCKIGS